MEVSGQHHALAALSPGKNSLVPSGYGTEWAPEPVLILERDKSYTSTEDRTLAVQPVARNASEFVFETCGLQIPAWGPTIMTGFSYCHVSWLHG
jgi:hypothetical protein